MLLLLLDNRWLLCGGVACRGSRDLSWLGSHRNLRTSVLAEHLCREVGLVTQEELMVICSKFGSTRDAYKVPENERKEENVRLCHRHDYFQHDKVAKRDDRNSPAVQFSSEAAVL